MTPEISERSYVQACRTGQGLGGLVIVNELGVTLTETWPLSVRMRKSNRMTVHNPLTTNAGTLAMGAPLTHARSLARSGSTCGSSASLNLLSALVVPRNPAGDPIAILPGSGTIGPASSFDRAAWSIWGDPAMTNSSHRKAREKEEGRSDDRPSSFVQLVTSRARTGGSRWRDRAGRDQPAGTAGR
jgi:hypothetical protein